MAKLTIHNKHKKHKLANWP